MSAGACYRGKWLHGLMCRVMNNAMFDEVQSGCVEEDVRCQLWDECEECGWMVVVDRYHQR